ncbi:MAG TPA: zf-HC2 domain-containing protein [Stellaceae bacterium]|nr:zf-HC2 domain-containing protein [Stellaceae bacterium]
MQKPADDRLVAYLDGELDGAERREIEAWLDRDPAVRDRLAELAATANLVRLAFDEVMHEPVPERLIAAARGEAAPAKGARVLPFTPRAEPARPAPARRLVAPLAAALCGLLIGGGAGFYGADGLTAHPGEQPAVETAATDLWLDNAAGYFKLYQNAGDSGLIDVPATGDTRAALQKISQNLPAEVRLPNLKPWGLTFGGARLVVVEGQPAAQLVYTGIHKAIGTLNLIIGSSKLPDIPPTFARRQQVNLLYWRHQGRAYVLAGQADIGTLWGIANDIAWQLDAI